MTNPAERLPGPSRDRNWQMFDRISGSYDLLNRLLSMRRDVAWRKLAARTIARENPSLVLDVATGTGDQILAVLKACGPDVRGIGLDLAGEMLAIGGEKMRKQSLHERLVFGSGDAQYLPVPSESVDAACISFGIRNVPDTMLGLSELHRVIRPGGIVAILECAMPSNALMRRLYLMYFRHILPTIGGWVSGASSAYRYLNETVESFPCGPAFCSMMEEAGFQQVTSRSLTLGVAALYVGRKEGSP